MLALPILRFPGRRFGKVPLPAVVLNAPFVRGERVCSITASRRDYPRIDPRTAQKLSPPLFFPFSFLPFPPRWPLETKLMPQPCPLFNNLPTIFSPLFLEYSDCLEMVDLFFCLLSDSFDDLQAHRQEMRKPEKREALNPCFFLLCSSCFFFR